MNKSLYIKILVLLGCLSLFTVILCVGESKLDPLSQSRLNKTPRQTGCSSLYWRGYTEGNKSWLVNGCHMVYECTDRCCIKRPDIKKRYEDNDDFADDMLLYTVIFNN
jgi:hypothetical protein